jgi:hypothetical protein
MKVGCAQLLGYFIKNMLFRYMPLSYSLPYSFSEARALDCLMCVNYDVLCGR